MATQTQPSRSSPQTRTSGWLTFAAVYLGLAGVFNLIWGITALSKKSYFVEDGLVFSSLSTWGWVAIIIAAVQIIGAALIYTHKVGGMIMGIVLAMSGALLNFASIGAYPVWSIVAIVCSMLVLWAVTVHWEEL